MKKALEAVTVAALLAAAQGAWATPSTTFWTPATTYTQPYLVPHITYDTYFAEKGALQNDYGLTMGILPGDKVNAEIGFDFFYPGYTKNGFQVNAKATLNEGVLASWAPGLSVGIMNVGFQTDVSNYDTLHATLGKTLALGTLGVGGYYGAGSKKLWTNSSGSEERAGFMASYVSPDVPVGWAGLQKVNFAVDGMSGKNWIGGAGGCVGLFFNQYIDILTGPVFFVDKNFYKATYGADWMWSVQLDVDIDWLKKAVAPAQTPAP